MLFSNAFSLNDFLHHPWKSAFKRTHHHPFPFKEISLRSFNTSPATRLNWYGNEFHMKWLKCLCGFRSSLCRLAGEEAKKKSNRMKSSAGESSIELWTILLSVLEHRWRRKYLWNQLISHPSRRARFKIYSSSAFYIDFIVRFLRLCFAVFLFFGDDQQKLSKWTSSPLRT